MRHDDVGPHAGNRRIAHMMGVGGNLCASERTVCSVHVNPGVREKNSTLHMNSETHTHVSAGHTKSADTLPRMLGGHGHCD